MSSSFSAPQLLARVRVVLSHPTHPGNIGASARAMKTMGLSRLYLVNPLKFPHAEASAMAAHADDILQQAVVCDTLDEALRGSVYAIASTARTRGISLEVLNARQAGQRLVTQAQQGDVALLMGTEKWGLSTQEVSRCSAIGLIPCSPDFTSLNLAAAVQVFAYEIYQAVAQPEDPVAGDPPASLEDLEHFYYHLEEVLLQVGFLNAGHPKKIMQRMRRLFARARLESKELRILRGVLTEVQKKLVPETQAIRLSRND